MLHQQTMVRVKVIIQGILMFSTEQLYHNCRSGIRQLISHWVLWDGKLAGILNRECEGLERFSREQTFSYLTLKLLHVLDNINTQRDCRGPREESLARNSEWNIEQAGRKMKMKVNLKYISWWPAWTTQLHKRLQQWNQSRRTSLFQKWTPETVLISISHFCHPFSSSHPPVKENCLVVVC